MGGRGSSGTATKSEKAYIRQENRAQANDAKEMGKRAGAKYFEYTDKNGFKYSGETGNTTAKGGVYKAEYDEGVAELNGPIKRKIGVSLPENSFCKDKIFFIQKNIEYDKCL